MSNTKTLKKLGSKKTIYKTDKVRPELLETFETNESIKKIGCILVPFVQERDEFTSLCPKTGQPDHAKLEIIYIPKDKMVESKSLKLYLFSFRNTGEFHEDVCARILNDLFEILQPYYIRVFGDFAPRGGLAIKPLVDKYGELKNDRSFELIKRIVDQWDNQK